MNRAGWPSSKIVAPFSYACSSQSGESAARSSAVRGARIGIALKGMGGRAGTPLSYRTGSVEAKAGRGGTTGARRRSAGPPRIVRTRFTT